jgi:acetyl esterase/lipase
VTPRRAIVLAGLATLLQTSLLGQATTSEPLIVDVGRAPDGVIPIWPAAAPGGERVHLNEHFDARTNPFNLPDRAVTEVTRPTLSIFRAARPDGSAILIAPGGGFSRVVVEHEGWETARWFTRHGATVYVMTYRFPQEGWAAGADTPLQDAQRAIRVIRARATRDDVDSRRVMAMGFSAGGYVMGSLAMRFAEPVYQSIDATDGLPARPDAAVLMYPVATMREPYAHSGSRANLLGPSPTPERVAKYSLETNPPAGTPPVFLLHAGDDASVPVENSLAFYTALKKAGIPAVLHIFERGGHGFGLRGLDDNPARVWPQLVLDFGAAHGVFASPASR